MDKDPIRRGKETVHVKWNPNAAILSGDTMMALAYEFIMKAPEHVLSRVFTVFNRTAIEVCEGQQYDMNFENALNVSIPDYMEMIRLKTAVLLAGSLKIGAVIGGSDNSIADALYRFGESMGIAFQLKDDLLDVFSDEEKFGKTKGGDIVTNKKTYLYLKAFELAKGATLSELQRLFSDSYISPDEKVEGVKKIYEELKIRSFTEDQINRYYTKAMTALEKIEIPESRKSELIRFARQLKQRDS